MSKGLSSIDKPNKITKIASTKGEWRMYLANGDPIKFHIPSDGLSGKYLRLSKTIAEIVDREHVLGVVWRGKFSSEEIFPSNVMPKTS